MKKLLLLCCVLLFSCSTSIKISEDFGWKDNLMYKLYITKTFDRNDYKKYKIVYKNYFEKQTIINYYDFNNDSIIDVYAFFKINKINKNNYKITYDKKAYGLVIDYDKELNLFYVSENFDKKLKIRFFEKKDVIYINEENKTL